VVLGFLRRSMKPAEINALASKWLTTFRWSDVRASRAGQSMDETLSCDGHGSRATKAVLLGAHRSRACSACFMTAAGTVPPRRAGFGAPGRGLQAIATARRLGAVVEAYGRSCRAGEQVKSSAQVFGSKDIGGLQTEDKGGYAVELSEEACRGRQLMAEHATDR